MYGSIHLVIYLTLPQKSRGHPQIIVGAPYVLLSIYTAPTSLFKKMGLIR